MGSTSKTKKNLPKNIHEMSKETLQEILKKKKDCNAKALLTVEKLCEPKVDEEWFLDNLQFINQCHFDDVTVERAITKICGYPLCDQKLEKVPVQQFHISTRYKKVFDITERKNFCSSTCYKSAVHIKKQLFTSPLWFRDQEVIPKYTILKSANSSMYEEVVFCHDKVKLELDGMKRTNFINIPINISKSINEEKCENFKLNDSKKVDKIEVSNVKSTEVYDSKLTENNFDKTNFSTKKGENENIKPCQMYSTKTKNNNFEISKNSKLEKTDKIKITMNTKKELIHVVTNIEKCIFEWFSLDTLLYLFGEEKLIEISHDKAIRIKEIINSKLSVVGFNDKIDKIIKLYGLLDTDLLSKNDIKTNLKPLPDYSALKEEGKTLEIKVRAFYQGQLEVKPVQKEEKQSETETNTDSDPIYLPLIDSHAQISLRRKILLDKLNKVLPELIGVFSSSYILQMNEVRNLVSTFTLSSHNIIFKPREWYLIGTILIKLLCLKDKQLELLMNSKSGESQVLLILSNYQLRSDYLEDLLERLTDSTHIIKKLTDMNV